MEYFTSQLQANERWAKCNICDYKSLYIGTTSKLINHLSTVHKITRLTNPPPQSNKRNLDCLIDDDDDDDENDEEASIGSGENQSAKKRKVDRRVLQWVIANTQPISVVDCEEFRSVVSALDPNYQLPCRQTFSKKLLPEYVSFTNSDLSQKRSFF